MSEEQVNKEEQIEDAVEVKAEDENKDILGEAAEEAVEEVSAEEAVEEEDIEEPKVEDKNDEIFITEEDVFKIKVKWYKDADQLFVDGSEEDFNPNSDNINEFSVTFKYPSQGDYEVIMNSTVYRSPDEMKISDILQMELTRMVTLVRDWSLDQEISRMVELDPSIIKGMLSKVRDIVGMKGIL